MTEETQIFLSFPLPDTARCVKCDTDLPIEFYLVNMDEPPVKVLWNVCLNCRRTFAKEKRKERTQSK